MTRFRIFFPVLPTVIGRTHHVTGARSKFWGVAGSEDFACATLPTIPLDFQGKI